jgi:TonB family protein
MKRLALSLACLLLSAAPASAQPEPEYYTPGNGVVSPRLLRDVKPNYPPSAVSSNHTGTVLLQCVVNTDGSVGEMRVTRSLDPVLDQEALRALKQWRFIAGTKAGRPVRVMVDVEMSFYPPAPPEKGPLLDSPEVSRAGPGVTLPRVMREVKPAYPDAARAAGLQGSVQLECVVLADGSVGHVRVVKGIEAALDAEAIKALKQWEFKPGSKDGRTVPVQIGVEMTFAVR